MALLAKGESFGGQVHSEEAVITKCKSTASSFGDQVQRKLSLQNVSPFSPSSPPGLTGLGNPVANRGSFGGQVQRKLSLQM